MCTSKTSAIVSVLSAFVLLACDSGVDTPTELIDGLLSYSSPNQVALVATATDILVVEDSKLPDEDERPDFDIYTVDLRYEHLGMRGVLSLNFYNDRLMQTTFYPEEADKYLALLKTEGIDLASTSELNGAGNTKVMKATDWEGKFYVAWIDRSLEKEFDNWISNYS